MKNWQIIGVLSFLIIGTVLMSGCTNTGSTTTPRTTYSVVTVTPTVNTAIAHTHGNYKVGDIVLVNSNAFHNGENMYLIILEVDSVHLAYYYDYVYREQDSTQWYRRGSKEAESMESFDVRSDFVFDHVDISKINQK